MRCGKCTDVTPVLLFSNVQTISVRVRPETVSAQQGPGLKPGGHGICSEGPGLKASWPRQTACDGQ
jgi:hypothetical protein